jgi:hypothetical protein
MTIDLNTIDRLTGGRLGTFDVVCPLCGPFKSARGQRRKVLRVYRTEPGFAGFHCARCGQDGFAHGREFRHSDDLTARVVRAEMAERDRVYKAQRLALALWLWRRRRPITGSVAERYLREARGIRTASPPTLAYLPPWREHPPTMIAAFGMAYETEETGPGRLAIADAAIRGVHLTRLKPDGSGKAVLDDPDEDPRKMIGRSTGSPIVLAPMNDMLALGIVEGIEDGLSIHQSLGIGVWAAGAASRMPALADLVPAYTDTVSIFAHDDRDGQRHAAELGRRLRVRMIDTKIVTLGSQKAAA